MDRKIIKNGIVFASTNSADIYYDPSGNVLSPKTNNVQDAMNEVSKIIKETTDKLSTNITNTKNDMSKNYAKKSELNGLLKNTDLSNYATKKDITSVSNSINNSLKIKISYYNTVDDMKKDKSLVEGCSAITLGYYYCNDTGGAQYYILKTKPTNRPSILLNNGYYAVLKIRNDSVVNVISLGMDRWGSGDCSQVLNSFIALNINVILYFPGGTYKFNSPIKLPKGYVLRIYGETETYDKNLYYFSEKGDVWHPCCETVLFFNNTTKNTNFITLESASIFSANKITFLSKSGSFNNQEYSARKANKTHIYSYSIKTAGVVGIYSETSYAKINDCKFIGFSSAGVRLALNNSLDRCVFRNCNTAITCKSNNLNINNCDIMYCNSGIDTNNASKIDIKNICISNIVTFGIYSNNKASIGTCNISGKIMNIEYAGIKFFAVDCLKLDIYCMKCATYFSQSNDPNEITKDKNSDEKLLVLEKASAICIKYISHSIITYNGYRARLDSNIETFISPCVHFSGVKWVNTIIFGITGQERDNVCYMIDDTNSRISAYTTNRILE